MHKVTITATVSLPDGTRIFKSEHTAEVAGPSAVFGAMVQPIEGVLSDAHRHFFPTEEEKAADAKEDGP
jgi:hypothetical protein